MRSYRIVLTMAALLMPTALHAQAKEPAPLPSAEAAPADARANDQAKRTSPPPKSLMGMVMGALIASAEQAARTKPATAAQSRTTQPHIASKAATTSASPADTAHEQVAVQSEP